MLKVIFIIIIFIVVIGSVVLLKSKTDKNSQVSEEIPAPTVIMPTISDSIKVDLTPKAGNKAIMLKVSGLDPDVESVEYELTYTTGAGLPRGVLGKITTTGEKQITRDDIVLGTCSSGKCVYDTGVTAVDLSLKINTAKGSSVFRKTYELAS